MAVATTTALAYAAIAASLAGAGVSAYSASQQAKAQEEMGVRNAQVQQSAADNEALAATESAKRQREENKRRLASIRGMQAKAGVNIGQGSTLDVLGESAAELELQALDLFRQSHAKQQQLTGQAGMSLWEGQQASSAANTQAIGTLLGGVSSTGGMYNSYVSSGVLPGGGNRNPVR